MIYIGSLALPIVRNIAAPAKYAAKNDSENATIVRYASASRLTSGDMSPKTAPNIKSLPAKMSAVTTSEMMRLNQSN